MRRALPCLVALAIVSQFAALAFAEESRRDKKEEKTVSTLSGSMEFTGVLRESWFDKVFPRSLNPTPQDEGFFAPIFALNATVKPAKSVTLFLELKTAPDAYAAESHRLGDNANIAQFREAWLRVDDLFGPKETSIGGVLQAGLLGEALRLDLRNLGRGSFMMDPANSENPFTGLPLTPAAAYGAGANLSRNTFMGGNPWINNLTGIMKESEAGGLKFTVVPHENVYIDLGAFAMLEGGIANSALGTYVYFFNFDFEFDLKERTPGLKKEVQYGDRSLFNILFTAFQNSDSVIIDAGLGIDIVLDLEGIDLEIYVEGHYQNGEYYRYSEADGTRRSVFHEAYGGFGGLRLMVKDPGGMKPYIDISGWYVSGDDGDVTKKNRDFLSLESVNDTLIIESSWGLDIDCNYFAAKGEIGFNFPKPINSLKLSINGGWFQLNQVPLAWVGTARDDKNGLGYEIDARISWAVTEQIELFITFGYAGGTTYFKEAFNAKESVMMLAGGINARF